MKSTIKRLAGIALTVAMLFVSGSSAYAATNSGTDNSLPAPYGPLIGSVEVNMNAGAKIATADATTSKAVTRIRAKVEVHYSKGGALMGSENSGWVSNSSHTAVTYDTYNVPNRQNGGLRDGFPNTKIKAYATADAITSVSYVVYTSVTG